MNVLRTELNLDLQEPLRILQVSDCHLSACCEEDSDKAKEKSKKKTAAFRKEAGGVTQEQRLKEVLELAEDYDALVFTGDVADSPSRANLELLQSMLDKRMPMDKKEYYHILLFFRRIQYVQKHI